LPWKKYNKKVTDEDIIRVLGVPRLEGQMKAMTLPVVTGLLGLV
jgi:hypothetical protein